MEKDNSRSALIAQIVSMLIFSTIGIFRRHIPLPSSMIAMMRGLIGMLFLLSVVYLSRQRLNFAAIRANAVLLALSSVMMGFNWIALFEAYRYTSVATATLCYYMAPIIVMLISPVLLGERLTKRKLLCVLVALIGMVLVSGFDTGVSGEDMKGVLLGLIAAALYASVILTNKRMGVISAYDKTIVQLGVAGAVLVPYMLLTEDISAIELNAGAAVMLLLVCVLHTGFAYWLYFGSLSVLRAQTVALLSYIDPVMAIVLSALLLGESMTPMGVLGAVLVLGATIMGEMPERTKEERNAR